MSTPRTDLASRLMCAAWNTANHLANEVAWSSDTPDNIFGTMVANGLMDNNSHNANARFVESEAAGRLCDTFAADVDELVEAAKAVISGRGDIGRLNAAVKRMEEAP